MIVVVAQRFQRQWASSTPPQPGTARSSSDRTGQASRHAESRKYPFLVEPGALGKIQHVDPVELVVMAFVDQPRDGVGNRRIRRLFQD